jgi:hypothetical protein
MRLGILLLSAVALAQEPAVELTPLEKQFQQSLDNVTLTGWFTVGDSGETREDRYTIERVTKIKDDVWKFDARIQYNKKDFRAAVNVPVKWAGDTPVLTLANYLIQGHGVFSARILIHNGMYAGTWGAQDHGGKMFGKIVKNSAPPPSTQ